MERPMQPRVGPKARESTATEFNNRLKHAPVSNATLRDESLEAWSDILQEECGCEVAVHPDSIEITVPRSFEADTGNPYGGNTIKLSRKSENPLANDHIDFISRGSGGVQRRENGIKADKFTMILYDGNTRTKRAYAFEYKDLEKKRSELREAA